ncbi:hypothetical protein [Achromobacter xylosoxidans]|uniref:hypothetical protein n=1 Tax=Alcaligenes xylosoxydans xylosoxydans TaxID=85698 RepID=UPI0012BBFD9E|nr:hypothetical protein [Achromobacter xylosoxidans]
MKEEINTQKAIGPTFPNELAAAGLLGQHFSWTNAGDIEFFEDTPDLVKDQVMAVYAKHAPSSV